MTIRGWDCGGTSCSDTDTCLSPMSTLSIVSILIVSKWLRYCGLRADEGFSNKTSSVLVREGELPDGVAGS